MLPIVIAGPTGTGKSELALRIAEAIGGEIVNYDSVQIYRGFDIGSAKPSAEVRARVPHHLFDIVDADAGVQRRGLRAAARDVDDSRRIERPILAGGTFFYLRALLHGLPEMPGRDESIRARIRRIAERPRGNVWLHRWLSKIDPQSGRRIAPADRHRVERALEVWLISGRPISEWERPAANTANEMAAIKIGLRMERRAAGRTARCARRRDVRGGPDRRNARPAGALSAHGAAVRRDRIRRGGGGRAWAKSDVAAADRGNEAPHARVRETADDVAAVGAQCAMDRRHDGRTTTFDAAMRLVKETK